MGIEFPSHLVVCILIYKIGWLSDFKGTRVCIYIVFVIIYLYQYMLTKSKFRTILIENLTSKFKKCIKK